MPRSHRIKWRGWGWDFSGESRACSLGGCGWQDKLFCFPGGGEDFVEVYGDAEGDEEEAANSRAFPVWRVEWDRGGELVP